MTVPPSASGWPAPATCSRTPPNQSRVVILLTDGNNNAGQIDPLTAASALKALEIKAYTIGVGRPDAIVGRALDEQTLREVAETTGALYYRATDARGLRAIYDEINELEKSEIEERVFTKHEELMAWALVPALVILLFELALRNTLFRRVP